MAFRIFRRLAELLDVTITSAQDGDVLTYDSGTSKWVNDASGGGGGAPTDVDYLVGTANGSLSAEIVVGTSPGGELGGTWASPTVDATHSGSSHAAVQAAAEATAASALSTHEADTTSVHGITDTSTLYRSGGTDVAVADGGTGASSAAAARPNLGAAPNDATYITQTANSELSGEQALGSLATGIVKNTTTTGVLSIAAEGTDYYKPGGADVALSDGGTGASLADPNADRIMFWDDSASAVDWLTAGTGLSISGTTITATGANSTNYAARSSNTILGTADNGYLIDTTASFTQTLTAAATLTAGWWAIIRNATNDGTTVLTVDPNSTETIDGLATIKMYSGETRLIICDGSNFKSTMLQGGFAKFTADGTFVVPAGIEQVTLDLVGGGGGGGGGRGGSAGGVRNGGGGGGGVARARAVVGASLLGSAGASITVTVGTVGTHGNGGSAGDGTDGTAGGNTTFGTVLTAFGGGRGSKGGNSSSLRGQGGGGGGVGEAGTDGTASSATVSRGGGNSATAGSFGMGGAGGTSAVTGGSNGGSAESGGGAGGNAPQDTSVAGSAGGTSVYGGGGGGGGGGMPTGNTEFSGGAGGNVGVFVLAGAGGGALGATNGGGGTTGADGNLSICGQGGGGGGGQDSGTGGAGGNGGTPGGGGGGGGGGTTTGGNGGDGGRGEARVWYA